jgi:hypothetical protein
MLKGFSKLCFFMVFLIFLFCGIIFADEATFKQVRGRAGFWRVAQDGDGVWWFLSPAGKLEFLNTVTNVQPFQKGRDKNGPHYVSPDWKGGIDTEVWDTAIEDADKNLEQWAARTVKRVEEAGFKGTGGWCNRILHKYDVTISRVLSVWSSIGRSKLFYDPDWSSIAEDTIKSQVLPLRENKNLVGYFIDNELGWKDGFGWPGEYFDGLDGNNPNRQEVTKVIRSVWKTVEEFNKDWEVELKSWEELNGWSILPKEPARASDRLRSAWLYYLAKDYFKVTTELIRRYDGNHLILGVRYKGGAPVELFRASRGFTDVQSINIYRSDARLNAELMGAMYKEAEQPIVISEYGFHSLDGRSGNPNLSGFIWGHVIDQQARADGYRFFTTRMARVPYIIGADWFQWNDEPPSGREDGEDVNFGVVDIKGKPYKRLVKAIRRTRASVNKLHAKSFCDKQEDVWGERLGGAAIFNIPYLAEAIILDGDLNDWKEKSHLEGLRYIRNVGIERSDELVLPKAYLGWSDEGLYLGVEVLDKKIQSFPLDEESVKNIWRIRSFDYMEFWVSTRVVEADQKWYDRHCQDFLFLPDAKSDKGGTVVRWHQFGDALEGHLVPDPDVKYAVRFGPNRYILEMFVPASVLYGFDTVEQGEISGNLFVRNWQDSIDYYWLSTELMPPNSWGRLKLLPKAPGDKQ